MADDVPADVRNVVEQGLGTYGVSIDGEITGSVITDTKYEVEVPFTGELLLDDTLSNHGPLLYNKEGEIEWTGIRDGRLVLTVDLDN